MDRELYKAAYEGDIRHVQDITEQLNLIVTPKENTILHVNIAFSRQPSSNFVKQVLEICPTLLIQVNDSGDTPLHLAAKKGLVDIVKVLIEHAKAEYRDLESNVTAVEQMLRMTNNDGNTALHQVAQSHNSVELVKLLMREDPDFPYGSTNNDRETPLYIVASRGSLEVVVEMLKKSCTSAIYKGPRGMTILHAAVKRNHLDITRKILEKEMTEKPDENGRSLAREIDEYGWTPLHYAAYYGHFMIAESLLEFDASAACIADECRKMTALHLAAGQGHLHMANLIKVFCPACIEQVDNRGWNYIHFFMCTVPTHFGLRLLYKDGYKDDYLVNSKDYGGNTPLLVLASISQVSFAIIKKAVRREFIESTMQSIRDLEEQSHQLKDYVSKLSEVRDEPYKLGVVRCGKDFIEIFSSLEKEREMYLVVAALIATVTFTAGLTLPGGYIQDKGTAVLIKNAAFQVFIISNVVALVLSLSAVVLHILWRILSLKEHLYMIMVAHICVFQALGFMMIAFLAGTCAILRPSLGLAILTAIVGSSFFLIATYFGVKMLISFFDDDWKIFKVKVCKTKKNITHLIAK